MKSALLIIDLQTGLFDGPGKPFGYEDLISKINNLSLDARNKDIPVVFVQHESAEGVLKFNSKGWALVDDLKVENSDHVVRKKTPNSFLRTNLQEILQKHGIEQVIVCGYATEFCVDSTIRAAAALGYHVQIVSDCHTTHDKEHASAKSIIEHHNQTLQNMKSFGVQISTSTAREILNSLG